MKIVLDIIYFICLLFGIFFALLGIMAFIHKDIAIGLVYIVLAAILIFAGIKLNVYIKKNYKTKK